MIAEATHDPQHPSRRLRVVPAAAAHRAAAERLAVAIGAEVLPRDRWEASGYEVVLWLDDHGIGLRGPPAGAKARHPSPPPPRARAGREALVRALGAPAADLHVVDATGGWGADAGVLAAAGARVTLLERSPAVAAMLAAALARWRAADRPGADRLSLVAGDAVRLLPQLTDVDVVYLDPFYPGREGAATTAAPLRWLRELVAREARTLAEPDVAGPGAAATAEHELLAAARAAARSRVVVKRPRSAPPLAGLRPSGSLRGRVVRLDLYAPARVAAAPDS